ncbi:ABC transporter ATP-binding protein [Natrononativus amylolyticus]|uniref:ABC transporter ATP-binding protein n=1 Tax=Natrononativus amylolyticus TaxID=2963434 RepID=UPI0020CE10D9|nr:ABC transporter ATP-binding protein [Natrononativus amylolyticus]
MTSRHTACAPGSGGGTVEVVGLTKCYGAGSTSVEALSNVSVTVQPGSITGLLGTNGAGKTTLMKSVLGLVTPSAGTVRVDGVDVCEHPSAAHRAVAAVFEGARNVYWRLTPRENVSFFAQLHGVPRRSRPDRVRRAIDAAGIEAVADTTVTELSRGMKQRCALACAFVRDTPILLLDEPTLGLDFESQRALLDELVRLTEQEGRTVLLSSHDMGVVERVCDRVVVVDDGAIVADESVDALKTAFATRTYSVTLESAVATDSIATLAQSFDVGEVALVDERTRFDVLLSEPGEVYALVDELRQRGHSLRSLERVEPALGEIFSSITTGREQASLPDDRPVPEVSG